MKLIRKRHDDHALLLDLGMKLHWLGDYRRFRHSVVSNLPCLKGVRVLDFGCGSGQMCEYLRRSTPFEGSYVGSDPGFQLLRIARRKWGGDPGNVFVRIPETPALPFHDGSFDAVICSLVTHQISTDNKLRLFREMFRVLRPGGVASLAEFGEPSTLFARIQTSLSNLIWGCIISSIRGNTLGNFQGIVPPLLREAGFSPVTITRQWKGMVDVIKAEKT